MKDFAEQFAERASKVLASPWAIIALPICCGIFLLFWQVDILTNILSILALTFTQLVLLAGFSQARIAKQRDIALHAKIDGLIKGIPDAPNELIGIEHHQVEHWSSQVGE